MKILRTRKRCVSILASVIVIVELFDLVELRGTRWSSSGLCWTGTITSGFFLFLALLLLFASVFGFGFIIGEFGLIFTNFFVVEIGRVASLHTLEGLGKDERGVCLDIVNLFSLGDTVLLHSCGARITDGIQGVFNPTKGLTNHTNDLSILGTQY